MVERGVRKNPITAETKNEGRTRTETKPKKKFYNALAKKYSPSILRTHTSEGEVRARNVVLTT